MDGWNHPEALCTWHTRSQWLVLGKESSYGKHGPTLVNPDPFHGIGAGSGHAAEPFGMVPREYVPAGQFQERNLQPGTLHPHPHTAQPLRGPSLHTVGSVWQRGCLPLLWLWWWWWVGGKLALLWWWVGRHLALLWW